jgi:hypothetical protein
VFWGRGSSWEETDAVNVGPMARWFDSTRPHHTSYSKCSQMSGIRKAMGDTTSKSPSPFVHPR